MSQAFLFSTPLLDVLGSAGSGGFSLEDILNLGDLGIPDSPVSSLLNLTGSLDGVLDLAQTLFLFLSNTDVQALELLAPGFLDSFNPATIHPDDLKAIFDDSWGTVDPTDLSNFLALLFDGIDLSEMTPADLSSYVTEYYEAIGLSATNLTELGQFLSDLWADADLTSIGLDQISQILTDLYNSTSFDSFSLTDLGQFITNLLPETTLTTATLTEVSNLITNLADSLGGISMDSLTAFLTSVLQPTDLSSIDVDGLTQFLTDLLPLLNPSDLDIDTLTDFITETLTDLDLEDLIPDDLSEQLETWLDNVDVSTLPFPLTPTILSNALQSVPPAVLSSPAPLAVAQPGSPTPTLVEATSQSALVIQEMGMAPALPNFKGNRGDRSKGSNRADRIVGTLQNDVLNGLSGDDVLLGRGGSDRLNGGKDDDRLDGGTAGDSLTGGSGNDILLGGSGNDILIGGAGNDLLTGGTGNDVFQFNAINEQQDTILDFNPTADLIDLRKIFATPAFAGITPVARFQQFVQVVQVGTASEVQVDADGNGSGQTLQSLLRLENVAIASLSSSNFVIT